VTVTLTAATSGPASPVRMAAGDKALSAPRAVVTYDNHADFPRPAQRPALPVAREILPAARELRLWARERRAANDSSVTRARPRPAAGIPATTEVIMKLRAPIAAIATAAALGGTGAFLLPAAASAGEASMGVGLWSVRGRLSFRRIVDIPFETCVAALDSWQRTWQAGELPIGRSRVRGPAEHDRDTGTYRIEVQLARGPLRPLVHMRLDIDRWSSSSTALELIPFGRIRPTARYFRAGHLLLDSLVCSLPQHLPPAHARRTASQPHALIRPGRPRS
jgi:hypothetical protein